MRRFLASALLATACLAPLAAADGAPAAEAPAKAYPLTTCVVSGEALDSMGGPVAKVYDGQEVKFCCKGCIKPFEKKKADFLKKLDAAPAAPAEPAAKP
jgi:hypothetical protein